MKKVLIIVILIIINFQCFGENYTISCAYGKDTIEFRIMKNIFKEIFKRAGNHTIEVISMPAERSIIEANLGNVAGEGLRYKGVAAKYPNLVEVETPIFSTEIFVYSTNEKITEVNINNLKNYTIIFRRGSKVAEIITEKIENNKIYQPATLESAIEMLKEGRGEILLGSGVEVDNNIKKNNITGIIKLKKALFKGNVHLLMNKKYEKIIPELNRAIQSMKKDGAIDKIINNLAI